MPTINGALATQLRPVGGLWVGLVFGWVWSILLGNYTNASMLQDSKVLLYKPINSSHMKHIVTLRATELPRLAGAEINGF